MAHSQQASMPAAIADLARQVIEAAQRIRPVVTETPVERIEGMVPNGDVELFFKLENFQQTGSFKLRGASNKILSLSPALAVQGVIAASNGNHGLGVAAAAKRAAIAAEVYVSTQVSPAKLRGIQEYGASIQRTGNDPLQAELAARAAASAQGKVFISPYNDVEVMAGQGTLAVELLRQLPVFDALFVAVGGGGLIGGIGACIKSVSQHTQVVGCWPENSPVLYESMKAGRILDVPETPTLSESTAGGLEPGSVTLDICSRVIDSSVLVTESEILDAMRRVRDLKGWLIEGAAAVAVAAFIKNAESYRGKRVAVIICGGNASEKVLAKLG
ncbi:MAG: Pyridoxal-5-phosphate-dependent protein beta subunit [Candidatus Angelobacter sp.]|nr:Pyridoxal-5-phosphate-dependent protein beta subunit [Candidatus Angelobacter sp.]